MKSIDMYDISYLNILICSVKCRVLKAWHLYTQVLSSGMGKGRKNKVLKLGPFDCWLS
jgi:hypothetical protein